MSRAMAFLRKLVRSLEEPVHPAGCGCAHHRPVSASREAPSGGVRGFLAQVGPALACAVCPACLATYAKAFSVVGFSAWLSETQHLAFLSIAIVFSVVFGIRRARKLRQWGPFAFTSVGCALLVVAHVYDDARWPTWFGLAALFVGGVYGARLASARSIARPVRISRAPSGTKREVGARRRPSTKAVVRSLGAKTLGDEGARRLVDGGGLLVTRRPR